MIGAIGRMLMNASLKSTADRVERKLEAYYEEIDAKREELAEQQQRYQAMLQERVRDYQRILAEDKQFMDAVYQKLVQYVQYDLQDKSLALEIKQTGLIKAKYSQERNEALDWITVTKQEMSQLEEIKNSLLQQSDLRFHLRLVQEQNPDFPTIEKMEDAYNQIKDYRETLLESTVDGEYNYQIGAVNRLLRLVKEKNRFLDEIRFIDWVYQNKGNLLKRLFFIQRQCREQIDDCNNRVTSLREARQDLMIKRKMLALDIASTWEEPIERYSEELERVLAEIAWRDPKEKYYEYKEKIRELYDRVDEIKIKIAGEQQKAEVSRAKVRSGGSVWAVMTAGSSNASRISDLKSKQYELYTRINEYREVTNPLKDIYQQKSRVGKELAIWRKRRGQVYSMLKKYQVYLLVNKEDENG